MRRILIALLVGAAVLACAGTAQAAPNCLPDGTPQWIDYASVSVGFRDTVFKRPGLTVALYDNGTNKDGNQATAFRQAGAAEVYWEEHMEDIVGKPASPKPANGVDQATGTLVGQAKNTTGCQNPAIALNELLPPAGASTASMTRYRANVLAMVQGISNRGARPYLLLPSSTPLTGAGADFFKSLVPVTGLIAEIYFNNKNLSATGPLLASRTMRTAMRNRLRQYLALGADSSQVGIMVGFQSASGQAGREGLQPSSAWFDMVKLNALAAKQVLADTAGTTIWSWGWGTFNNPGSADSDKQSAACVYLWTRDNALCDAPGQGIQFNTSLTDGQIDLAAGIQCAWTTGSYGTTDLARLARALKGDRAKAASALLERGVLRAAQKVRSRSVKRAERTIIRRSFGGSGSRYRAALKRNLISRNSARQVISDQLAIQAVSRKVRPRSFSAWLSDQERTALSTTTCVLDEVPAAGAVDVTAVLPFLRVGAAPPKSAPQPSTPTVPPSPPNAPPTR